MIIPGTTNAYFREDLWLVVGPEHANNIANAGWSKDDVKKFIFENALGSRGASCSTAACTG